MTRKNDSLIEKAKEAAMEVLLHNNRGSFRGLPRTAGWGYPEPYTRDLLISSLGVLTTKNEKLIKSLRRVMETLAKNQSPCGHISSLVHDSGDRGSSDCTPLFLIGVGLWRIVFNEPDFLEEAAKKALVWMEYRSPTNRIMVSQLPTSDWRDEQWVLGYGLYVNALVYIYLRLFGLDERAQTLKEYMCKFTVREDRQNRHVHEGLVLRSKPYYALWSYKIYRSERFDLLGNSLAILSGIASKSRANRIIAWIEAECKAMRQAGDLAADLPPNFFPYIRPEDPDWMTRYSRYNRPGEYHNGGIWPFVCGFYVAALVAAGKFALAQKKLIALAELVRQSRGSVDESGRRLEFGFNEWHKAQDGTPKGQDWQSWSAAMFLYAAACVEQKKAIFFDDYR